MLKTILTNFDKFVQFLKIYAEDSFWENLSTFQEIFKEIFKNCWKNFQEIFVIKYGQILSKAYLVFKKSFM